MSIQMPRYHSNHCALVAIIYTEGGEELKRYHHRTQRFPLSLPLALGPSWMLDTKSYCNT
jgi:hypothetical protein